MQIFVRIIKKKENVEKAGAVLVIQMMLAFKKRNINVGSFL